MQRLKKTKIIGSVFLWVFVGTALSAALFLLAKSVRGPSPVLAGGAAKARKSKGGSKVPDVDLRKHSVDLEDVLFDTFNGSFLRLSDANRSQILSLRDAIRPIYKPAYAKPDALPWLRDSDLVLGYISKSGASAYPLKVLNFREIANDVIDGVPVLVSYCPLCGSGAVYERKLDGKTLVFGNTSALYESDMVMFDHQTGSYWFQTMGEAIVGEMTGKRLVPLPSATLAWGDWKRLHPDTRLLAGDGKGPFSARYGTNPFSTYARYLNKGRFSFPVSKEKLDSRIRAGEVVITAELGSDIKAYPVRLIGKNTVNDEVGGRPVAIFSDGLTGAAFIALHQGKKLTFGMKDGRYVDRESGSAWTLAGRAAAGPLKGARMEPVPSRRAYWFSIAGAVPGVKLHSP